METPFDRNITEENITVEVNDVFYRDEEILAFYDDILNGLLAQEKSPGNMSQFLNMIQVLIDKKEYRKASGVVYQALSRYPNDMDFIKLKIEILIKLKEYYKAIEFIEENLEKNPQDISLMMLNARIFSIMGDEKGEEKVYQEILNIPKNDYLTDKGKVIAMRNLADLYFKQKRFKEAEEIIRKVLRKSPDESIWAMYFSVLLRLGKKEESKKARDKFARYKRARAYFDKGSEYESNNKYNLALANYRKGLEIYPDDPLTNLKVGSILMYRKRWYSRAEEYIRKAVELDPEQTQYRSNLVICLRNQGKYREAFEEAKIAEKQDPLSNIHHLRRLAIKIDRSSEFEKLVKKIIRKDEKGDYPAYRYELGLFYESMDDSKEAELWYRKAMDLYIQLVNRYPDDWHLYVELGHCCKRLKLYKEAEAAYKTAEQLKGSDLEEIYENLVEIYQQSRQPEKSTPYLRRLIRSKPGNLINYVDLGINYLSRFTSSIRRKKSR